MKAFFEYRSLTPRDLDGMFQAFRIAFSDYPQHVIMNKEQFVRKFVQKLKIDFNLSAGAFTNDELVGFIFTTVNYYKNKMTAYNGGTGVIPTHRGHKLTARMYSFLLSDFSANGIEQCVLEVLTSNTGAIRLYESLGFEKTQRYLCYKLDSGLLPKATPETPVNLNKVRQPDWYNYEKFQDYNPSFLDSRLMVNKNLSNETIVEAYYKRQCVGYAIYQPGLGRVGQIAVNPDYRSRGVGHALMQFIYDSSINRAITAVNVSSDDKGTIRFLENLGFRLQIDQYEMVLSLR